jgi:hypothetical protein
LSGDAFDYVDLSKMQRVHRGQVHLVLEMRRTDDAAAGRGAGEEALAVWQQGDPSTAVNRFLETDWSARPLFPSGSVLNLSEAQFKNLPASERDAKSNDMMTQLSALKQLAVAVEQTGLDALAKKDMPQARKCFTSLKKCGEALDTPDSLAIVKLVGQALKKKADAGLAKSGP